jgi:hypothetical protein
MPEVNSVVAICDSHSQAEEAVKELQRAGFDMTKVSIVGDVKTGRIMLVCDRPWAFAFIGSTSLRWPLGSPILRGNTFGSRVRIRHVQFL